MPRLLIPQCRSLLFQAGVSWQTPVDQSGRPTLEFGYPGRNEANKDKVLSTGIHKLMFLVAGDKKHRSTAYLSPFAVLIGLSLAGVDEDLMFPCVVMSWGKTTGSNGKDAHAEILSAVCFADNNPAGNPFHCFGIKSLGGTIFVIDYFHGHSMDEFLFVAVS